MKNMSRKLAERTGDVLLRIRGRSKLRGSSSQELKLKNLRDQSEELDDLFPEMEFDCE